ncbi:MAG: hypothetical protein IPP29_13365 [Bacteroidetes bacterium]|nr:hypothetical protein [Bacteroidota bacterium]
MKIVKLIFLISMLQICSMDIFAQGYNHVWKLGYGGWFDKGIMTFDTNAYQFNIEHRPQGFVGTQATISDAQGNFLMSSNGVWIANANNDTMLNGDSLNPGPDVNAFPHGLLVTYGNVFLPFTTDSNKFFLVHQAGFDNYIPSIELYYSIIDKALDTGLGGVVQKNISIFQDTIGYGLAACKHANGRDWWVVAMKDSTNIIYKVLITPSDIQSVTTQSLGFVPLSFDAINQLTFSQDGTKFISATYNNIFQKNSSMVLCDFNRCTGMFSNTQTIPLTNNAYLWGLAFSASGKYAYACSSNDIFQVNTSSLQIDTVATYDGFYFPLQSAATTFLTCTSQPTAKYI